MLAGGIGGALGPLDPNQPVGASWDGAAGGSPYATAAEPHRAADDQSLPNIPLDGPLADRSQVDPGAIAGTIAAAVAEAEHQHHPGAGGPAPADVPVPPGAGQSGGGAPTTMSPGSPGAGGPLDAPYIAATVAEAVAGATHQHHPGAFPAPAEAPGAPSPGGDQHAPVPDRSGTPGGDHGAGTPASQAGSGGGQPDIPDQPPPAAVPPLPDAREPVTVPDNPLPDLRP
jgi:hypothetical protein